MTSVSQKPKSRPDLRLVRNAAQEPVSLDDFDGLFRRYSPYVAAIGFRMLGRDDELDDLVQDVFFEAHRGLASLRDPGALKRWLAQICVRRATRRLRKRRLMRWFRGEQSPQYENLADSAASPEQAAQIASAYRALEGLAAEERVAWVLRHVEGHSLDELCELCGCSKSTVQRRLRAAYRHLGTEPADE